MTNAVRPAFRVFMAMVIAIASIFAFGTASASAAPVSPSGAPSVETSGVTEVTLALPVLAGDPGDDSWTYDVALSAPGGGTFDVPTPITSDASSGTLSFPLTGLEGGADYSATYSVDNGDGYGLPSASLEFTTDEAPIIVNAIPDAPVTAPFVISAGSTTAHIGFDAVSATPAVTGYTVTTSPGGITCGSTAPATSCTLTGLTNGTTYSITYTATNTDGTSAASPALSFVPHGPTPAPSDVIITSTGNEAASLSWTAPTTTGGGTISSYIIRSNNGQEWTSPGSGTTFSVSDLDNGVVNRFKVAAVNNFGTSEFSSFSAATTARTVPGVPTDLTVVDSGDEEVTARWTPPLDNGGSRITSYTVEATPTGGGGTTTCTTATSACEFNAVDGNELVAGTYDFVVFATNVAGNSADSAPVEAAVFLDVPDAVTLTGVTFAGDGSLLAEWSASPDDGGTPLTSYTAVARNDSDPTEVHFCTVAPDTSPLECTLDGLTDGVAYDVVVYANNAHGTSPVSNEMTATPEGRPSPPLALTVTATGSGSVSLSWTAPTDVGSGITDYGIQALGVDGYEATQNVGSATTNDTVTGLTNGVVYTFYVFAQTAEFNLVNTNQGPASAPVQATPATTPSAVSAVTVTPITSGTVKVSWTPGFNGGSPITNYAVTALTDGQSCSTTSTSCIITGLTNDSSQTFQVTPSNAKGAGTAASTAATAAGVPDAPANVNATDTTRSATITWDAPADNGSAITGYTVITAAGNFICSAPAGGSDSCVISPLPAGSNTFLVYATNALGASLPGTDTIVITGGADPTPVVPAAPTDVVATPGDTKATIQWTASGGATAYTVLASGALQRVCATSGTSCVIDGLANGTPYTFDVYASNANGASAASVSSAEVTPNTAPSAPQTPAAAAPDGGADGELVVTWTDPATPGNAIPDDGFTATAYGPSGSAGTCSSVDGERDTCTITGLNNGTTYEVYIVATSDIGPGAAAVTTGTPGQVAQGAPAVLNPTVDVWAGDQTITVLGYAPLAGYGGGSVGDLMFRAVATDEDDTEYECESAPGLCQISGLTNGTEYSVEVFYDNEFGESVGSAGPYTLTPGTAPGAPTGATAEATPEVITVSWTAPADTGGLDLTGYVVQTSDGLNVCATNAAATECSVRGLNPALAYQFYVYAANTAGTSGASAPTLALEPNTVPSAPTDVLATPIGYGFTNVNWTLSGNDGGTPITGYTATAWAGNPLAEVGTCSTIGAVTDECDIAGLSNGVDYVYTVHATNASGNSPESQSAATTSMFGQPTPPRDVAATAGDAVATVEFDRPLSFGSSDVTAYTITAINVDTDLVVQTCTVDGMPFDYAKSCVFSALTNGTEYIFRVTATNSLGTSEYAESDPVTPQAPQVISFPQPEDMYVTETQNMLATASSGLDVTYAPTDEAICTVAGNVVTAVAEGTCEITASQAGDDAYLPADDVSVTFEVVKMAQMITFPQPQEQVVGTTQNMGATASSTLPVTYTSETTDVCTVAGFVVTALLKDSDCTITANQAGDATYAAADPVTVTFETLGVPQTITFTQPSNMQFNGTQELVATSTSLLAVTFTSTTPGICTVSGTTLTAVGVGTCDLTASQAGNDTYAPAEDVERSLTVTKATNTINFAMPNPLRSGWVYNLNGTATSGTQVYYTQAAGSTRGACVVSWNASVGRMQLTVSNKKGAICRLIAMNSGNANYLAAPNVVRGARIQ